MNEIEFLREYADCTAAKTWRHERLDAAAAPPASFTYGGADSASLRWTRTLTKAADYTDYPDAGPRLRHEKVFRYETDGLAAEVTCTEYPDYPVVEFQTRIRNTSSQNSPVIRNLKAIDDCLVRTAETVLHYNKGSMTTIDDYHPHVRKMTAGTTQTLSVDTGKPTSLLLPNFNVETGGGGVIAVMSWQGCWKADFDQQSDGLRFSAGQLETEFVLFPGEEYRTPLIVLLFYKGKFIDGQNVWRRWWFNHNLLRKQGKRMGKNAIVCIGDRYHEMMGNAADDMREIDRLSEAGMESVIDCFVQDAGWYDCEAGGGWQCTGNWYPPADRYPNGIREVSDYTRAHGMKYAMWIEPERIRAGTKAATDLAGKVIAYENIPGEGPRWLPEDRWVPLVTNLLVNYAIPEAVDTVIDMIDGIITNDGLDMYRQDFNINPAPFWRAEEARLKERLGVPRLGVVEEKYTAGYLRLFATLIDRHPGLIIDGCAGGGTRGDLESMRMAFLHTRSDQWGDIAACHNQTYGAAMWLVVMGSGTMDMTNLYDRRSRLVTSNGTVMTTYPYAELKQGFQEWERMIRFMWFDYYPLSDYDPDDKGVMAMQFNDPDAGEGLAAAYVRKETDGRPFAAKLSGLDKNAVYKVYEIDSPDKAVKVSGGRLMDEGIDISTTTGQKAWLYFYTRADS